MNSSFRPVVETLEHRDALVILMPVLAPLTLFTIDNPPTFPSNPGPASATIARSTTHAPTCGRSIRPASRAFWYPRGVRRR